MTEPTSISSTTSEPVRLTTVPIVDFSAIHSPSSAPADRRSVGEALFRAFRDVGFVYLSNFIPPPSSKTQLQLPTEPDIEKAFSYSKRFFSLPGQTKMLCPHPPEGWKHRGYSAIGREKVFTYAEPGSTGLDTQKQKQILELKESYEMGREDDEELVNVWPPEESAAEFATIENFRPFFNDFYEKCHNLAQLILSTLAVGMNLDESFFAQYHKTKSNQLRLLHYPEIDISTIAKDRRHVTHERIVPHSDLGTITLLFQEGGEGEGVGAENESEYGGIGDMDRHREDKDAKQAIKEITHKDRNGRQTKNSGKEAKYFTTGLEVENPKKPGEYIKAENIPGTILVNIGDLLQRWTSDVLRSTRHRVRIPVDVETGKVKARYSMPYFVAPDKGTLVKGIEGLGDTKYPDVDAYHYISTRLSKAY